MVRSVSIVHGILCILITANGGGFSGIGSGAAAQASPLVDLLVWTSYFLQTTEPAEDGSNATATRSVPRTCTECQQDGDACTANEVLLPSDTCIRANFEYWTLTIVEDGSEGDISVCLKKYKDDSCTIPTNPTVDGCDLTWPLDACTGSLFSWKRFENFCSRTTIPRALFVNPLVELRNYPDGFDSCQQDTVDDTNANPTTDPDDVLESVAIRFHISQPNFCLDTQLAGGLNSANYRCKDGDLVMDAFTDNQCTDRFPSDEVDGSFKFTKECSRTRLTFSRALNCDSPTIFCKDLTETTGLGTSLVDGSGPGGDNGNEGGSSGGTDTNTGEPPEVDGGDSGVEDESNGGTDTNVGEPPEVDSGCLSAINGMLSLGLMGMAATYLLSENLTL